MTAVTRLYVGLAHVAYDHLGLAVAAVVVMAGLVVWTTLRQPRG